jgi:hypothetical protein
MITDSTRDGPVSGGQTVADLGVPLTGNERHEGYALDYRPAGLGPCAAEQPSAPGGLRNLYRSATGQDKQRRPRSPEVRR